MVVRMRKKPAEADTLEKLKCGTLVQLENLTLSRFSREI
jgi:hypothetical protein